MEYLSADFIAKSKSLTDEEIIAKLKINYDARLFAVLVNRYEARIIKRCQVYVKDEETAQDLAQEIFVKLFLKLSDFKQDAKFNHWLFTIANNASLDYLRRQKKKLHTEISQELAGEIEEIADVEVMFSHEISVQLLEDFLEQIPPEDKLLLLLKYKEKISIKDIQISLNLSESAIKMRLKRARDKINKLYLKYQKENL